MLSHTGKKHFVSFIDDIQGWCEKSEVFSFFKKWKAQVETYIGKKMHTYLCLDNGDKYISNEFTTFCE